MAAADANASASDAKATTHRSNGAGNVTGERNVARMPHFTAQRPQPSPESGVDRGYCVRSVPRR
jgi:hypothetical protein